jgi:hypothetical protein
MQKSQRNLRLRARQALKDDRAGAFPNLPTYRSPIYQSPTPNPGSPNHR